MNEKGKDSKERCTIDTMGSQNDDGFTVDSC